MKQIALFQDQTRTFHGGELARGRRKALRPLARKRPIHLTLKSTRVLLPYRHWIRGEVARLSSKFGVKVLEYSLPGDHIHLVLRIPGRREYNSFIRSLTGILARRIGRALWQLLPFTRVISWGRDLQNVLRYVRKNEEESRLQRAYEPRKDHYRKFRPKPEGGDNP